MYVSLRIAIIKLKEGKSEHFWVGIGRSTYLAKEKTAGKSEQNLLLLVSDQLWHLLQANSVRQKEEEKVVLSYKGKNLKVSSIVQQKAIKIKCNSMRSSQTSNDRHHTWDQQQRKQKVSYSAASENDKLRERSGNESVAECVCVVILITIIIIIGLISSPTRRTDRLNG